MLTKQIGIISESSRISFSELAKVSAALQKQAVRDLGPIWDIQATVDPFPSLDDIPVGYWPIIIMDDIPGQGALGYHADRYNQPFSVVQYTNNWSLTASHEMLEMLVDPFGNKLVPGDSIMNGQGRVQYLVEVADPCESPECSYSVNGIIVSDFYTPHYFDPIKNIGLRYSYTGAIENPREVLPGGYLSWYDPSTNQWWQITYFGSQPNFRRVHGMQELPGSLRSRMDQLTKIPTPTEQIEIHNLTGAVDNRKDVAFQSDYCMGEHWRKELIRTSRPK